MQRFLKQLFVLGAALMLAVNASAFSLMGPFASWQTTALGYNLTGDIGGPMNLAEDYRVTVPLLTYGYDATFLNFFGSNGVAAVEAAMTLLNTVPAASAMSANLTEFPLQAVGPGNATAGSLGVFDLKSAMLSTMLGQMGLASPERWVYSLRNRVVIQNTTNYTVIQRNFDPVTWRPTNVVNGVLYTYSIQDPIPLPNYADAIETPADRRTVNPFITVASVDDGGGLGAGQFFTSLTRDDYGALRYLLRRQNVNIEDISTAGTITLANNTSPYAPVQGTNANTNVVVAIARRPGVDKVTFYPTAIDSLLGVSVRSLTNRYTDVFYSTNLLNSALTNQIVDRVTTLPDILVTAGDLGLVVTSPFMVSRPTSSRWVNNSALNTQGGGTGIISGPGVIPAATSGSSAIVITFSTLAPSGSGSSTPGRSVFIDERFVSPNSVWGYFDTTTIFSVFPDGLTIQDLERQLYGR